MKFGIFDHLDRNDLPLRDYYESRLQIIEAYDRLGFYAYHVAEHHSTPLGMAASPSVFLSAVAQRTQRLRFGPMVYALAALSSAADDRGNLHARPDERQAGSRSASAVARCRKSSSIMDKSRQRRRKSMPRRWN